MTTIGSFEKKNSTCSSDQSQFRLTGLCTHGLCYTGAYPFAIPIASPLSIERLTIPIESESAATTRTRNLKQWPSPVPAFLWISYIYMCLQLET
jgi:hypothetical protein